MNIQTLVSILFVVISLPVFAGEISIIENPCYNTPSFPYRKYMAFAVDADSNIVKYKSISDAGSIETGRSYKDVLEFLIEKKIVSSDGTTKLCDGTPYVSIASGKQSGEVSDSNSQGSDFNEDENNQTDPVAGSKSKKQNDDHLRWANPLLTNSPDSYWVGINLSPVCAKNSFIKYVYDFIPQGKDSSESLKIQLRDNLQKNHFQEENKEDILVDTCPANTSCLQKEVFTYRAARKHIFGNEDFGALKLVGNHYVVRDVYCGKDFSKDDFKKVHQDDNQIPGKYQIPFHEVVNLEHTWPQSKFNFVDHDKLEQKSDFHHIFATDSKLNSIRGNYPFAEVDTTNLNDSQHVSKSKSLKAHAKAQGCTLNTEIGAAKAIAGVEVDIKQTYFEPPAEHRGNVARALFYMSIKYDLEITEVEEYYLRKWHVEDPVDAAESVRHEATYSIQGNRNPFIDFPDLVEQIENF